MNNLQVLFAEDELALAHIVRESLEECGFRVTLCSDGRQALRQYQLKKPDILVLDIMMPNMDGFELAARIRENDKITPIIFLTARSQVKDVVKGFEIGANDYLKKPFGVEELIVRMKALLSPSRMIVDSGAKKPVIDEIVPIGKISFNPVKNELQHETRSWHLTSRESDLLTLLCQNKHDVISRKILLQKIWGNDTFFNARSMDVFITKLRKHLEADPQVRLINIRGVGYKLVW